jgi:hypothetical protein
MISVWKALLPGSPDYVLDGLSVLFSPLDLQQYGYVVIPHYLLG